MAPVNTLTWTTYYARNREDDGAIQSLFEADLQDLVDKTTSHFDEPGKFADAIGSGRSLGGVVTEHCPGVEQNARKQGSSEITEGVQPVTPQVIGTGPEGSFHDIEHNKYFRRARNFGIYDESHYDEDTAEGGRTAEDGDPGLGGHVLGRMLSSTTVHRTTVRGDKPSKPRRIHHIHVPHPNPKPQTPNPKPQTPYFA